MEDSRTHVERKDGRIMCDSKYLIDESLSILDALKRLNSFSKNEALTLFVIDAEGRVRGSLTDGDIRRKLVEGVLLSSPLNQIMHRDFLYLDANRILVPDIHRFKEKGIVLIPILDEEKRIVDVLNLKQQKSLLPIDALLMAGGKGERLRPLTERTPKPLLKVGEKAIIDYNIDRLINFGVKHISVTVNYLREQIEEHFAEKRAGIQVQCVREPQFLGTIGSVKFVEAFHNDTVLIMNSDLFTNIDFEDFYLHFKEHDADMSVAAVPYSVSVPYGIFELEGRNIEGVCEKPIYNYYANGGIYLIKRELLEEIPDNSFFNATDFMEMLVCEKKNVIRFPLTGYWIDIGKHEDYQRAQEIVKHL